MIESAQTVIQEAQPIWPKPQALVRPARDGDIPALLELAQEGIDRCLVPDTAIDFDWLAQNWKRVIAAPELAWHAAVEVDGGLVGYSHGYCAPQWHTPKPMAYLSTMYVREAHRSSGSFNDLVRGFTAWAQEARCEGAWAALTNGMGGAAWDRLWRKHEYHYTGTMYERLF